MPTTTKSAPAIESHEEFVELGATLREAASAYYSGAGSLMDDAAYDKGIRALQKAAHANPSWYEATDLLSEVAAGTASGTVGHRAPMLSLDNAMDKEELGDFLRRLAKAANRPIDDIGFSVSVKLDGLALALTYEDGKLVRVVTRGNGFEGEDVTEIARHATGIPAEIDFKTVSLEVRGECVMTHLDFAMANEMRTAAGGTPFANPRNAVAGSIRAKNRAYKVPFTFYAYGLVGAESEDLPNSAVMDMLEKVGFAAARSLVPGDTLAHGADEMDTVVDGIEAARAGLGVDIDGVVIRADDPLVCRSLGESTRAPRFAIAYKFAPDTRQTKLLNIVVDVGRTGNLSFTAELEPVFVGGVTISSATVHNPSMIAAKGLRLPSGSAPLPQEVWVRRAGEVIPEIVGPVDATVVEGSSPFAPPGACPRCGGGLDRSGLIWRCLKGRACALETGILYAVGRDQLDIEGLADKTVRSLVESGAVGDVADLFDLDLPTLLGVERLGEANAKKIFASIETARTLPLNRVFCALGVALTGRTMSRRLAKHFGTLETLRTASVEELCEVEGVGAERAASIRAELEALAPVIERLVAAGIGVFEPDEKVPDAPFVGMTVVVSGAVPGLSRNEANEWVEKLGGKSSGSVSAKTSLLVAGDGAGSKMAKAESLGVAVMAAEEFAALVAKA
jgi:DNA ligase (NAD+)